MQRKAKSYFLLLMVIFLLGVLTHFLIPLQIVIEATKKVEQNYNGYKIEVEQNTVRALAFLNSGAIGNQIQLYQNVRSITINLFQVGSDYDNIDPFQVPLNSAYQLANMNSSQLQTVTLNKSMWFLAGVSSIAGMSPTQQWMYFAYTQIQPYLQSIGFKNSLLDGLQSLQIYISYEGEQIYFQFPSSSKQRFANLNETVLNSYFNDTINNFQDQGRIQTIFQNDGQFKACSPILLEETYPFAVVCLNLDKYIVTSKITSILNVPQFQLSTSQYYLVRPLYKFEGLKYPQIISSFESNNLSTINVPSQQYFEQLQGQQVNYLFNSKTNYVLNIQQLNTTKTYYVIPIQTYNDLDTKQICLYLVVVNNFQKSQLNSQSRFKQFFVAMIIPSVILFMIAALGMGFIMRPIFAKLHQTSTLMNDYCHFIKRNDMHLEIAQAGETSDIRQIFQQIKQLNLLNKLSTPAYLQVSNDERIIKLLRAIELFEELNYSKVNIYENLADCYQSKKEYHNALKYLKMSVDSTIAELGGVDGLEKIIKEDIERSQKLRKQNPITKKLRHKLYKFCVLLYHMFQPGDKYILQEIQRSINLLKKVSYRTPLMEQYCFAFILGTICSVQSGEETYKKVTLKLQQTAEMIIHIENSNSKFIIPPEILKSYWYFLRAKILLQQKKDSQAYNDFISALDGERFDPQIHLKIKCEIDKLIKKYKITGNQLKINNMFGYLNYNQQPRQFILIADASNPKLRKQKLLKWKSQARKMANHIFDNYIQTKDRIGISEFCNDLKVICNLIQKGTNQNMLKKQVMACMKARDQYIHSQLIVSLAKAIERTKNLKRQKIFIFFLKEGPEVYAADILEQIEMAQDSTFIFLVESESQRITSIEQGYFVLTFEDFHYIDIILGQKSVKRADNITPLF